jgi:hypothetical protein
VPVAIFSSLVLMVSTLAIALTPASVATVGEWSAPAALASCSAVGGPAVVFPRNAPAHGTGPGAIVWGSDGRCGEPAGARVAAISSDDVPEGPATARTRAGKGLALSGPIGATEGPYGQIALAGGARAAGARSRGLLLSEGRAGGVFSTPLWTGGASEPVALASGYLGDVAVADVAVASPVPSAGPSPTASAEAFQNRVLARARARARGAPNSNTSPAGSETLELWVHRHYQDGFQAPAPIASIERRPVEGLTIALDYRSDGLAVWAQDGEIYGRSLPVSNRSSQPVQRVAAAAGRTAMAALLSDDNRGIVVWSETARGVTSVYGELTGTHVRFGRARLLERFADPHGQAPPAYAGPRLVRLASESVMLAWTGVGSGPDRGRWAAHSTAVDLNGVGSIETISPPGRDGLLAGLAAGPADDGFVLIDEPAQTASGPDLREGGVYVARGGDEHPDRTRFGAVQEIVPAGAMGTNGEAGIGVDPDSDRAIAAWRTPTGGVESSVEGLAAG